MSSWLAADPASWVQLLSNSSAWLKTGAIDQNCTAVQAYATTYVLANHTLALLELPAAESSSTDTGGIVGGALTLL